MARVTFEENQPIQSLSGTIGVITYRTMNGKTFAYARREPELPKNASRKERAAYKERMTVNECVRIIQGEMEDFVAVKNRAKDLSKVSADQAAFMAQKDQPGGKKTMRAYLWMVEGDLYDAQHNG